MTLWWQQEQKEAAGAVDSCPQSALCAAGCLARAEAKGRRSRALVDPCPAQQQLLLACSPWRLAKRLGLSLLFDFGDMVLFCVLFSRKTELLQLRSLFLVSNMPCDFSIS